MKRLIRRPVPPDRSSRLGYSHIAALRSNKSREKQKWGAHSPIKFVAAEAGFLPPGPDAVFADMILTCEWV